MKRPDLGFAWFYLFTPCCMSYRISSLVLGYSLASRLSWRLLLLVLLAVGRAWGQAPSTGGPTPAPAAVPLDGGASLLLAAGAAFGLRRLRRAPGA